ncbi:hypothetical protein ABZ891_32010 [Streptomyces sp. NPDC047023]|uniref:hypothetical protein n=1 Tax=Streptomyces sp. NPDC047023 TaxID=3155139 RepID=UPI0033EA93C9
MKIARKRMAIAVGAALAGAGLAFPAVAMADGFGPPAGPGSHAAAGHGQKGPGSGPAEQLRKRLAESLAKDLGVPAEKVTASLDKFGAAQREQFMKNTEGRGGPQGGPRGFFGEGPASEKPQEMRKNGQGPAGMQKLLAARLDEAVAQGKLTREQADSVLAAIKAGVLPGKPDAAR